MIYIQNVATWNNSAGFTVVFRAFSMRDAWVCVHDFMVHVEIGALILGDGFCSLLLNRVGCIA